MGKPGKTGKNQEETGINSKYPVTTGRIWKKREGTGRTGKKQEEKKIIGKKREKVERKKIQRY